MNLTPRLLSWLVQKRTTIKLQKTKRATLAVYSTVKNVEKFLPDETPLAPAVEIIDVSRVFPNFPIDSISKSQPLSDVRTALQNITSMTFVSSSDVVTTYPLKYCDVLFSFNLKGRSSHFRFFFLKILFSDLKIPESSSKTNVLNLQEDLLLTGGSKNAHVDPQRGETIQMLRARLQQGVP